MCKRSIPILNVQLLSNSMGFSQSLHLAGVGFCYRFFFRIIPYTVTHDILFMCSCITWLGRSHNLWVGVGSIGGGQRFECTEMEGGKISVHIFRGGQNYSSAWGGGIWVHILRGGGAKFEWARFEEGAKFECTRFWKTSHPQPVNSDRFLISLWLVGS